MYTGQTAYPPAQQPIQPPAQQLQGSAQPMMTVDFRQAAKLHDQIGQLQAIHVIAKQRRAELEAQYTRETGLPASPFAAKVIGDLRIDPKRSYEDIMADMKQFQIQGQAVVREEGAAQLRLKDQIVWEQRVSRYLDTMRRQVQTNHPANSAVSVNLDMDKTQNDMALCAAILTGLFLAMNNNAPSAIVGSIFSYLAVKVIPTAIIDAAKGISLNFLSSMPHRI